MIYTRKLSQQYSELRHTFNVTDDKIFSLLNKIDLSEKKVLDFGCGDGRYAFELVKMGARSVVGVDNSPTMIKMANRALSEKHLPNVNFLQADGSDLPLESRSFDLVFANFVLHHFANIQKPINEISRVLKDGCYFLGTFNTFEVTDPQLFNTEIPLRLGKEKFVTVYNLIKSDDEVQASLKNAGLNVVSYINEEHPLLCVDPEYSKKDKIRTIKTIICLAKK